VVRLPRCHLKCPQRCLSVVLQVTGEHPAQLSMLSVSGCTHV
jgi:hypothetical protein